VREKKLVTRAFEEGAIRCSALTMRAMRDGDEEETVMAVMGAAGRTGAAESPGALTQCLDAILRRHRAWDGREQTSS
jgi:hypothetical protein